MRTPVSFFAARLSQTRPPPRIAPSPGNEYFLGRGQIFPGREYYLERRVWEGVKKICRGRLISSFTLSVLKINHVTNVPTGLSETTA